LTADQQWQISYEDKAPSGMGHISKVRVRGFKLGLISKVGVRGLKNPFSDENMFSLAGTFNGSKERSTVLKQIIKDPKHQKQNDTINRSQDMNR
jgi:hypothetical protein